MRQLSTYLQRNKSCRTNANNGNSPKRFQRTQLPPLYYSIIGRNWQATLRRANTHPYEIFSIEDTSGNTPLHFACRLDPPVDVIKALMRSNGNYDSADNNGSARDAVYGRICHIKNVEGATALHVAASHRCSAEVIKIMVGCSAYRATRSTSTNTSMSMTSMGRDHNEEKTEKDCLDYARKSLVLTRSNRGRTPLHYACISFRGLGIEAFKILLEATIEASLRVEHGATSTGRSIHVPVINLKGNSDQEVQWDDHDGFDLDTDIDDTCSISGMSKDACAFTMQDQFGFTPLSLLFKRYRERVKYVIRFLESRKQISCTAATASVQEELGGLWLKARLIVCLMAEKRREDNNASSHANAFEESCHKLDTMDIEAARWAAQRHQHNNIYGENDDEEDEVNVAAGRTFRLVHASVALAGYGCPKEMIQLAISVYPNQVREMDEDGNLPLHIAAVASSFLPVSSAQSDEDSIISSLSSLTEFSASDAMTKPFKTVIRMLLRSYPEAVRIPHGISGRLPLILAIDAKKRTMQDGIKVLLEAFPAALETRDFDPKLYPYIIAAIGKSREVKIIEKSSQRFPIFRRKKKETVKRLIPAALFEAIRANPTLLMSKYTDEEV